MFEERSRYREQVWEKVGRVFCPSGERDWARSHAAVPCPLQLGEHRWRVFFGSRNANNEASIGYVEIDPRRPDNLLAESERPVLTKGALGAFDDSGVLPSCVLRHGGRTYLYYVGWNLGVTVPFRNFAGLAIGAEDGSKFERASIAPVIDRSDVDPFFCTNPGVIVEGKDWRCWYLSCVRWEAVGTEKKHYYNLRYATSSDGVHWSRDGRVAIDFMYPDEFAISCPHVERLKDGYGMWYSYRSGPRGKTYRIGYADSADGITWTRHDEAVGLDVSASGWDSEMISYGKIFASGGEIYMTYNGNSFGRTGFGLAHLRSS